MNTSHEGTYETRRDWLLAEVVIGFVSCATAITAISDGIVAASLKATASNVPWFLLFYMSGSLMVVLAVVESMCRRGGCDDELRRRFARGRMYLHCANALCWLSAFVWLSATRTFVASILYESLPLMAFNVWGAVEHAKALWLRPAQGRTCSLAHSLFSRLPGG